MKIRFFGTSLAAVCIAGMIAATPAIAANYTLNSWNINADPGPFGSVNVTLSAGVATITFTGLNGYLFGDGSSVGVNVNGSYSSPTIISDGSPSQFKQFTSSPPPVDGRGQFNLIV